MFAHSLNQCCHTYRRGRERGKQCGKPAVNRIGVCPNCLLRPSRRNKDINIWLLTENVIAKNEKMIQICFTEFIYPCQDMIGYDNIIIYTFLYYKILDVFTNQLNQGYSWRD